MHGSMMNTETIASLVQYAPLSEQAYAVIKQMILELRLKPGQVITEADLSEILKTSKSPIRTALIHLQRDGLVTITPYKDTVVAELDVRHVHQLYEVRAVIEPYVIRALVPQLEETDFATVAAILDRADLALANEDYPTFFGINTEFHGFFIKRYGNEFFWKTFQVVDYQMQRIRMISSEIMNHPRKQMAEHRQIFDAVCARDAEASGMALRAHILGYFEDLLQEIRSGHIPCFNTD